MFYAPGMTAKGYPLRPELHVAGILVTASVWEPIKQRQGAAVTDGPSWSRKRGFPWGSCLVCFVPRGIRRAMHPARAVKRAVTPRVVKEARRALHPLDNAAYAVTRSMNTKPRRRVKAPVYSHGSCPVNHRSADAAGKCRNR